MFRLLFSLLLVLLLVSPVVAQESEPVVTCWSPQDSSTFFFAGSLLTPSAISQLNQIQGESAWLGYPDAKAAPTANWGVEYGFKDWNTAAQPLLMVQFWNIDHTKGAELYASQTDSAKVWLFVYNEQYVGSEIAGEWSGPHPCAAYLIESTDAWALTVALYTK